MERYGTIGELILAVERGIGGGDAPFYRRILREHPQMLEVLRKLEGLEPGRLSFYLHRRALTIVYPYPVVLFRAGRFEVRLNLPTVGFPDVSRPGVLGASEDEETGSRLDEIAREVADRAGFLSEADGLSSPGGGAVPFNPVMIFRNRFGDFEGYLSSLKSVYRSDIRKVLRLGEGLREAVLEEGGFTREHYALYESVFARAMRRDVRLPFAYFQAFAQEIHEFRDRQGRLAGFIQMREMDGAFHALRIGFRRDPKEVRGEGVPSVGLYYYLLLAVIRKGIEGGFGEITFGPTCWRGKSKLGCTLEERFLYLSSSFLPERFFLKRLAPFVLKGPDHPVLFHPFRVEEGAGDGGSEEDGRAR